MEAGMKRSVRENLKLLNKARDFEMEEFGYVDEMDLFYSEYYGLFVMTMTPPRGVRTRIARFGETVDETIIRMADAMAERNISNFDPEDTEYLEEKGVENGRYDH